MAWLAVRFTADDDGASALDSVAFQFVNRVGDSLSMMKDIICLDFDEMLTRPATAAATDPRPDDCVGGIGILWPHAMAASWKSGRASWSS